MFFNILAGCAESCISLQEIVWHLWNLDLFPLPAGRSGASGGRYKYNSENFKKEVSTRMQYTGGAVTDMSWLV